MEAESGGTESSSGMMQAVGAGAHEEALMQAEGEAEGVQQLQAEGAVGRTQRKRHAPHRLSPPPAVRGSRGRGGRRSLQSYSYEEMETPPAATMAGERRGRGRGRGSGTRSRRGKARGGGATTATTPSQNPHLHDLLALPPSFESPACTLVAPKPFELELEQRTPGATEAGASAGLALSPGQRVPLVAQFVLQEHMGADGRYVAAWAACMVLGMTMRI